MLEYIKEHSRDKLFPIVLDVFVTFFNLVLKGFNGNFDSNMIFEIVYILKDFLVLFLKTFQKKLEKLNKGFFLDICLFKFYGL